MIKNFLVNFYKPKIRYCIHSHWTLPWASLIHSTPFHIILPFTPWAPPSFACTSDRSRAPVDVGCSFPGVKQLESTLKSARLECTVFCTYVVLRHSGHQLYLYLYNIFVRPCYNFVFHERQWMQEEKCQCFDDGPGCLAVWGSITALAVELPLPLPIGNYFY